MNDKIVEILGATPGLRGKYMNRVYDQVTDKYLGPIASKEDWKSFAFIQRLKAKTGRGLREEDVRVSAIIDTGVMHEHPLIKPLLLDSVDFTGEGPEDLNGHGTMVALLRAGAQYVKRIEHVNLICGVKLLNVKALDAEGRGTPENLVKAIEWSVENGANSINISAGIYRKKWGLFECRGNCEVCKAAEKAAKKGITVTAAAGNKAGVIYCPAKVGVLNDKIGVLAVAASDFDGKPLPETGYGNVATVGKFLFGPIDI